MTAERTLDTLVIGIDATSLDFLTTLSRTGDVPNVREVIEDGVASSLNGQIPPSTPRTWASLYTGVNPGKHGVFDFVHFDGYDRKLATADHVREHTLWTLLSERGKTSVVVNAPLTSPPDDVDGAILPGVLGPEDPACHPDGVLQDVRDAIGEYRVYPNRSRGDGDSDEQLIADLCRCVEMRAQAFCYLVDEHAPDFGVVHFQATDTAVRAFPDQTGPVRRLYRSIDEQIGTVLDHCNPSTVVLVSGRGVELHDGYEFRVNEFLRERGYLKTRTGRDRTSSWLDQVVPTTLQRGECSTDVLSNFDWIDVGDAVFRRLPISEKSTGDTQVDIPASMASLRTPTDPGIRLNVQGRDPAGIVLPEEYDRIRAELIDVLRRVRTPEGQPVFDAVRPREEFVYGPFARDAVDIVTIPKEYDHHLSPALQKPHFGASPRSWKYTPNGTFVAAGAGIDTTTPPESAHLYDVAPTVMAALGVPYTDRMDGRVLPVVEDTGTRQYPDYPTTDGGADTVACGRASTDHRAVGRSIR